MRYVIAMTNTSAIMITIVNYHIATLKNSILYIRIRKSREF